MGHLNEHGGVSDPGRTQADFAATRSRVAQTLHEVSNNGGRLSESDQINLNSLCNTGSITYAEVGEMARGAGVTDHDGRPLYRR